MKRKRLRENGREKLDVWSGLAWRPVDCTTANLGDFEDAVFLGLEEIDGNAYKLTRGEGSYRVESRGANPGIGAEDNYDEDNDNEGEGNVGKLASSGVVEKKKKKKEQKEKEKKKEKRKKGRKSENETTPAPLTVSPHIVEDLYWGTVKLHGFLVKSLQKLNFHVPTPIQTAAIPMTLCGKCDVVGAAETGSGKTLAFCLPVLDTLLRNWEHCADLKTPYALVISPTRELTMQISSVLREVCLELRQSNIRVEIVSVVGGMSEHKQRRQLSGRGQPVHIVVATPGRLCELMQDEELEAFSDMSKLRFLVVDEADRIVEEGHFPELQRVFSRIRDHETIAQRGQVPREVYAQRVRGTYDADFLSAEQEQFDEKTAKVDTTLSIKGQMGGRKNKEQGSNKGRKLAFEKMPSREELDAYRRKAQELGKSSLTTADLGIDSGSESDRDGDESQREWGGGEGGDMDEELHDLDEPHFDPMPTEEQMAEARKTVPAIPLDELPPEDGEDADAGDFDGKGEVAKPVVELLRQTLLYSATALRAQQSGSKKHPKERRIKGLVGERVRDLPHHLQQLLATVASERRREVRVVDVTGVGIASEQNSVKNKDTDKGKDKEKGQGTDKTTDQGGSSVSGASSGLRLPMSLAQQQALVPVEDKDVLAYHYLMRQGGRTLVFVNSIKTARRVDGLLRALGLNSRAIHAQLQQKQRLKALETFRAAPMAVLVATDVAARGLDIPRIQTVLHYDVARSPQVYVHRSGRTARANAAGISMSLVAPEDLGHHNAICVMLGVTALPTFAPDLAEMAFLRERVMLAKKIFTQSFVASQKIKESAWLEQTAAETGLVLDEYMIEEEGTAERRQQQGKAKKQQLDRERKQLQRMLANPVALASQGIGARNRSFVVFAK